MPSNSDIKECVKCGHQWISGLDREPKVCPRCKSYKWKKIDTALEHEAPERSEVNWDNRDDRLPSEH